MLPSILEYQQNLRRLVVHTYMLHVFHVSSLVTIQRSVLARLNGRVTSWIVLCMSVKVVAIYSLPGNSVAK